MDVEEDRARGVADELGDAVDVHRADVTREGDIAASVDAAVARWGRVDIMVNNAGILGPLESIATTDTDEWDRTIAVDLRGVFLGCKHAARVMIPRRSGVILNTASTAGLQGGLAPAAYTAAKHAVIGLTKAVAVELVAHDIRVNAVAPGSHLTPLLASVLTGRADDMAGARAVLEVVSPQRRAATADDVAAAFAFLADDEAWFANGTCFVVDGANEVLDGRIRARL